ncbi:hypothetical protein ElyMa_003839900 [Elysia marginata]|uniref:Uncharacterized protein n=1 Tax=Elysia marginata TaxID=1093978 RepID=A0AAV4FG85_9GAST|nr:hypothetical protein ElyMa_003839900 [Elysia marginata]
MAVVYVGINVFFSMALSAVISLLVLIIVQVNKVVRQKIGKLASRDIVTPLGSASHKLKDEKQSTDKSTKEEIVTKSEKRVKWADVRKRRPSNGGFADLAVTTKSTAPFLAEPSPLNPVDLDQLDRRTPTPSLTLETKPGMVRSRQSRAKSTSTTPVSPDAVLASMPNSPDKDLNEWAVVSPWDLKEGATSTQGSRESSMQHRDEVVTPSACSIDITSATGQTRLNKTASVFVNDMEAYDIW